MFSCQQLKRVRERKIGVCVCVFALVFEVDDVPLKKMPNAQNDRDTLLHAHTHTAIANWCVFTESCQLSDVILPKRSPRNMHQLMCQCGECVCVCVCV